MENKKDEPKEMPLWVASSGYFILPDFETIQKTETIIDSPLTDEEAREAVNVLDLFSCTGTNIIFCGPEERNLCLAGIYSTIPIPLRIVPELSMIGFPQGKELIDLYQKTSFFYAALRAAWLRGDGIEPPEAYKVRLLRILEENVLPMLQDDSIPVIVGDEWFVYTALSIFRNTPISQVITESYPIGSFVRLDMSQTLVPF
jgi:hypothetical protein